MLGLAESRPARWSPSELLGMVWRELGAMGVVTGGCGGTLGHFCAPGALHGDLGKRL